MPSLYLRPSADISVGHTLYPADSANAYSLINEEVADGTSTAIAVKSTSTLNEIITATSSFKLSFVGSLPINKYKIKRASLKYYVNSSNTTNNIDFNISMNGLSQQASGKTSTNTGGIVIGATPSAHIITLSDEIISNLRQAETTGNFPEIIVSVTSSTQAYQSGDKTYSSTFYLSTLYIDIEYSTYVQNKIDNSWKSAIMSYKKVNGSWVALNSVDEAATIMRGNINKRGHRQTFVNAVSPTCVETGFEAGYKCTICGEYIRQPAIIPANGHTPTSIPAVNPTCAKTGLSEGSKCSVCGTILVPQEVVPATGIHENYVPSGGKNICPSCGYVDGMGYVGLSFYTTINNSFNYANDACASNDTYIVFGGGYDVLNKITYGETLAYNSSLTEVVPDVLGQARESIAQASTGTYALFAGGFIASGDATTVYGSSMIDAYDRSLTKSNPSSLSSERYSATGAVVGDYVLFGGGTYYDPSRKSTNVVDAYDSSFTRLTVNTLSSSKSDVSSATIGDYAIFAGGFNIQDNIGNSSVDAYNSSLTKTVLADLPESGYNSKSNGTTVGNYAIVLVENAMAYDNSLTVINTGFYITTLDATTLAGYSIWGRTIIDQSLTSSNIVDDVYANCIGRIGNYVLDKRVNTVHVFTINQIL